MTIDSKRLETDAAYWDEVAPHWATAYGVAGNQRVPVWFNLKQYAHVGSQKAFQYGSGICFDLAAINLLVNKPSPTNSAAPEWAGKGLPPVGCECEVDDPVLGGWNDCSIKWIGRELVVVDRPDGGELCVLKQPRNFRPTPTKAQRDRDELADLIEPYCRGSYCGNEKTVADAIIAAGWTKP